ncbi:MAG: hypothetical protein H0W61_10490 [Bacteroidetes bacterium]|nr:hypothetical protein [Bacteroidota bacterium]
MEKFVPNKALFRFQYLPDYAQFLLNNKLEEFVTVAIRFCRELDLPLLRHLSKISEKELIDLSLKSYREILGALAQNNVEKIIENRIHNYVHNQIKDTKGNILLDSTEVVAEDIILTAHIRRKLFSFFLYSYTQNTVLHMLIATEVDQYTTQEHLLTTRAYVKTLMKISSD